MAFLPSFFVAQRGSSSEPARATSALGSGGTDDDRPGRVSEYLGAVEVEDGPVVEVGARRGRVERRVDPRDDREGLTHTREPGSAGGGVEDATRD